MLRVGINGFGRIGKAVFRVNNKKKSFEVATINDINPDNENIAYQLKYDSTYGRLEDLVEADEDSILVNGEHVKVYHERDIDNVPWENHGIDIVVDSSGVHSNVLRSRELAKRDIRTIVTHSPSKKDIDKTIIVGVNHETLTPKDYIISNSICDSNAFTPVINVLNREFGVEHGSLLTLHPWLSYQNLVDGTSSSYGYPGQTYSHYVLGRASTTSLIPKLTTCIDASCKVLDFLDGKFESFSYRVPISIVSNANIFVKLGRKISKEQLIELFKEEQDKQQFKIFYNNFEPLVSIDFSGSEYSAILDHRWTIVNGQGDHAQIVLWYDNEWGYSSRVIDLVSYLGKFKQENKM